MTLLITLCVLCASVVNVPAQDTPPPPSAPRSAVIPKIHEKRLANGLTVAVVERKGSFARLRRVNGRYRHHL
ncbi:MAG: hypothetical protein IPI76_15165 [Chloracidobacterium sp.]|nr:hypothetical protein [Chloracidobacterium sp.]